MQTFWDSFIDDYKNQLPYLPLHIVLEAFYFYCEKNTQNYVDVTNNKLKCRNIIETYRKHNV